MRDRAIEIVPMRPADLDEVVDIEGYAKKSPWPRQVFVEELDREWAFIDVVRARDDTGRSAVVGFCNYWLVRDEVHLLNVAVHPDHRRRGHGARLMERLLEFSNANACRYLTLEVRRSNAAAIRLYEAYGFEAVGMRPKYYVEDREDAIVMALEIE